MHLGHSVVELHVALADVAAVLDCFDALADVVGFHGVGVNGGLGDEDYGGAGEEGLYFVRYAWGWFEWGGKGDLRQIGDA